MTRKDEGIINQISCHIRSGCKTGLWFMLACATIPFLIICYLALNLFRSIWLAIISMRYPDLEFIKTINWRSYLETPRNPGVVHMLLHVEGRYDIEIIKEKLFKYVLDRKDKVGQLSFPRLRTSFKTVFGSFAWCKNASKFNVNNHVIVYPAIYKGRSINDGNIQEYVSTIVSKYMAADLPQWQIVIIPNYVQAHSSSSSSSAANLLKTTNFDSYYMLIRIHHLILSEELDLTIKDMCLLDSFSSQIVSYHKSPTDIVAEPMRNLIDTPIYIPKLYNSIMVNVCNRWNEFIYRYDANESFDDSSLGASVGGGGGGGVVGRGGGVGGVGGGSRCIEKRRRKPETVSQLLSIVCISIVTVLSDFSKGFYAIKNDPMIKLRFLTSILRREMNKRNLSIDCVWHAIQNTLHPINLFTTAMDWIFWIWILWLVRIPFGMYREISSLLRFVCGFQQIEKGFIVEYFPLIYKAAVELLAIVVCIICTPRYIYEELFENQPNTQHALQMVSLCGRKMISWSDKLRVEDVRIACRKHKLSDTELYYSTISATLNVFLNEFEYNKPKQMETCIQYIGNDYLKRNARVTDNDVNGFLCVKLPMEVPSAHQLKRIRYAFKQARDKQIALNLLYMAHRRYNILLKLFPATCIRLFCNYLTKKFTIALTQIEENTHNPIAQTLWGHKILDSFYFTPIQSNIGVSITMQQNGEYIRLGVMTDAQLSPLHSKISQIWTSYIKDIIENS